MTRRKLNACLDSARINGIVERGREAFPVCTLKRPWFAGSLESTRARNARFDHAETLA